MEWRFQKRRRASVPLGYDKKDSKTQRVCSIRTYWCGFDEEGKEKWYVEFNDGKIVRKKY